MKFKPMLADNVRLDLLEYPVLVSPKLDGVRAIFQGGQLVTRSLKPIPNRAVNRLFQHYAPLDGELIVGDPTDPECFRNTMKVISAFDEPAKEVYFHVFDVVYEGSFKSRLHAAHAILLRADSPLFIPVLHQEIRGEAELIGYEDECIALGYEGVMIRDPKGPYKFGRSTVNEGLLLKMKRKLTSEARVVGFVEQLHNDNLLKVDNLGYAERSSHQAGMVPTGVLGALEVEDIKTGIQFNVGTGFTAADRKYIWDNMEAYAQQTLTYEYLGYGIKDKPRHPVFKGWRMQADL